MDRISSKSKLLKPRALAADPEARVVPMLASEEQRVVEDREEQHEPSAAVRAREANEPEDPRADEEVAHLRGDHEKQEDLEVGMRAREGEEQARLQQPVRDRLARRQRAGHQRGRADERIKGEAEVSPAAFETRAERVEHHEPE